MASEQLLIKVDLDGADVKEGIKQIKSELTSFKVTSAGVAKSSSDAWTKLGKTIKRNVLTPLTGLVSVYAALRVVRTATQDAIEFSEAMSEVSTLVDTTTVSMAELTEGVKDLAVAQGQNEAIVAKGLYQAISAGVNAGAESLEFLQEASDLAIAGVASVESTVKLLASTLNAYAGASLEANEASDIFFTTVRQGVTTIPELASAFGRVTPIAANLGVQLDELGALFAALTKTGLSTDETATSLRAVFLSLLDPMDEGARLLKEWGLENIKARVAAEGFAGVLETINENANEDDLLALFGNVRALVGVLGLVTNEAESFNVAMEAMRKASGAVGEALEKQIQDPAFRLKATFNAARVGLMELADAVVTDLFGSQQTVDEFRASLEGIQEAMHSLGPVIDAAIIVARAFGVVVVSLAAGIEGLFNALLRLSNLLGGNFKREIQESNNRLSTLAGGFESLVGLGGEAAEAIDKSRVALEKFNETAAANALAVQGADRDFGLLDDTAKDFGVSMETVLEMWGALGEEAKSSKLSFDELRRILEDSTADVIANGEAYTELIDTLLQNKQISTETAIALGVLIQDIQQAAVEAGLMTDSVERANAALAGTAETSKSAKDGIAALLNQAVATSSATDKMTDSFWGALEVWKDGIDIGRTLATRTLSGLTRNFTGLFDGLVSGAKSGKEAWRDFASDFARTASRIVSEMLAIYAVQQLIGLFAPSATPTATVPALGVAGGGVPDSVVNPTQGFAKGGVGSFGSPLPVNFFAKGSVLPPGPQLAVMNEGKMREAVLPLKRGKDGVLGVTSSDGGGSQPINMQVSISAVDAASFLTLAAKDPAAIARVVLAGIRSQPGLKSRFGLSGAI